MFTKFFCHDRATKIMFTNYPNVFEAFHQSTNIHAHEDSSKQITFHDNNGTSIQEPTTVPPSTQLFDASNTIIGSYNAGSKSWNRNVPIAGLTSYDSIKGLTLNSRMLAFTLIQLLKESNTHSGNEVKYMAASVDDYLNTSKQVLDSQEINNLNTYLQTLQKDEKERLIALHEKYGKNVLTLKQMYLMVNRDAHFIKSNIRIILYAIAFVAIVMALMPSSETLWAKLLIGLVIIAFFVYLVMYIRERQHRRFTDYNKYFIPKGDLPDSSNETDIDKDDEGEDKKCTE